MSYRLNVKRNMSLERKQQDVVSQKDQDRLSKPRQIGSPDVSAFKSRSHTGQTVKKPAAEARRSLVDDDLDFDMQFDKGRCCSDNDDDCTWLSGGASPSTFFREYRLSGAYNVDMRLVSWLSKLADTYLCFTNKAEEKNCEDASTKCPEQSLRKGCKEDLDSTLLWNPDARGIGAWSRCSSEDATNCGSSLSPLSICHESSQISDLGGADSVISSQLSDIRRTNSMVSLLDEQSHLDNLPGPSCQRRIWCSEGKHDDVRHELVDPASHSSEALKKRDCNGEEPIFWPFNQNWSSEESWTYFSMSPLKDSPRLGSAEGIFTPSIGSKHCGRSLQTQNGCRRSLVFSSTGSKYSENRNRRDRDSIQNTRSRAQRGNPYPSRLEDSTKASLEVVPLDSDSHAIKQGHGNAAMLKSVYSSRNFLEDGFSSSQELPIETVVGLEEFDGHEGIDSEFNEDIFLLDELC